MNLYGNAVEWLGVAAGVCTSVSFMPQAWLTFRTRDVSGISLGMYSVFTLGVAMWTLYGLLIDSFPVLLANVWTLVLALAILAMKLRYGNRAQVPNT